MKIDLTYEELSLLRLGTETLREANPDDPAAASLDEKVEEAYKDAAPNTCTIQIWHKGGTPTLSRSGLSLRIADLVEDYIEELIAEEQEGGES